MEVLFPSSLILSLRPSRITQRGCRQLANPIPSRIQPIAGALALALSACDLEPPASKAGKSFDKIVENAGRIVEQTASAAGKKADRPYDPASDAALSARVKAALSADPGLRAITVDVNAADGVVTLYGTADTPARSHQAAMVALKVDGVRSVRNEMVIVRGS